MPCRFCELIATSTSIVKNGPRHIAVKDRKPKTSMHFLVIPRRHVVDILGLVSDERAALLDFTAELVRDLHITHYKLIINAGRRQGIRHLHVHVLGGD
jgi:diadenosine tetraphosphate (Ap4A) HIT family hydrolase